MTIDQLLAHFEEGPTGDLRILNAHGVQVLAVGNGVSVGGLDTDPNWVDNNCLFVGGRVGINSAVGFDQSLSTRTDLSQRGVGGFPSRLVMEAYEQVAAQIWQGDPTDDGKDSIAVFVSSADSSRPNSLNVGVRIDAVNWTEGIGDRAAIPIDSRGAESTQVVVPLPPPPYQGDGWSATWIQATINRFIATGNPSWRVFFGRCFWNAGRNGDQIDPTDADAYYEIYVTKHLNEARA